MFNLLTTMPKEVNNALMLLSMSTKQPFSFHAKEASDITYFARARTHTHTHTHNQCIRKLNYKNLHPEWWVLLWGKQLHKTRYGLSIKWPLDTDRSSLGDLITDSVEGGQWIAWQLSDIVHKMTCGWLGQSEKARGTWTQDTSVALNHTTHEHQVFRIIRQLDFNESESCVEVDGVLVANVDLCVNAMSTTDF